MYPDLAGCMSFYTFKGLPGNSCSFGICSQSLVAFESHHSNAKQWQKNFFFHISGGGREFLEFEMTVQVFPIWANWGRVPDDKKILIDLTDREHSHVDIVWAKDNKGAL